ncbi:MAG: glycosyltransferase [Acetatifactor sp.]|nr:glycosyltransferase [Acetatifactor sp.]
MSKKLLWISLMAPYDRVGHAGGKVENYYLKYVHANSDYDVTLLTLCKDYELTNLDLDKYGIENKIYVRIWRGVYGYIRRSIAWLSKLNICNRYAGLTPCDVSHGIKTLLQELSQEDYVPDCIVLQWTEILFMLPDIQKYYPEIPVIAVEEDVTYLGQLRRKNNSTNWLKRKFSEVKYEKVKSLELNYLSQVNLVVLNNQKDYNLVVNDGLQANIYVWTVYFQSYIDKMPQRTGKNIVFYGAMFREENWKSAEWFILHVMPLIEDREVKFVIIGSNPNKKLYQYENERIQIKGFVEDISSELANAMCMVAPLVLGAGIKVKILEALSCGIPVLTNAIGIEGIPAVDKESYFHCEKPEEYVEVITQLVNDEIDLQVLATNAKSLIRENFNYEKDAMEFVDLLNQM